MYFVREVYFVREASFDTFVILDSSSIVMKNKTKTLILRLSWGDWKKMCWVCGNKKPPVLK